MTVPALQADSYLDFSGISDTPVAYTQNDPESLRKIAGQFEALFIQMMLKSMRDASIGEGILDSEHSKTYQGLFDKQIAMDMSQQNGIGLAEMIVRQLSASPLGAVPETTPIIPLAGNADSQPLHFDSHDRVRAIVPLDEKPTEWKPATAEEFIDHVWPQAVEAAQQLGVKPEVLVAQAALETGWGKHVIHGVDGRNSFNLFGIKADASWQGPKVYSETVEYRDGIMRKQRAAFRAYDSPAASFRDYVNFLRSNPRYGTALQSTGNATAFTAELQRAGYATDPEYSNKINDIIDSEPLRNLKHHDASPLG